MSFVSSQGKWQIRGKQKSPAAEIFNTANSLYSLEYNGVVFFIFPKRHHAGAQTKLTYNDKDFLKIDYF